MKNKNELLKLTLTAVFIAIIAVMSFTPLGYLKVGIVSISFLTIPVVLGSALLGKLGGTILGVAFGATSFIQCFGMDAFGTTLMGINPVFTFLVCIVPRALVGFLAALIFESLSKTKLQINISAAITFISGALINTVGFVGLLVLFFGKTDYVASLMETLAVKNLFAFALAFAGINSLVEAAAAGVFGAALAQVIKKLRSTVK